MKELQQKAALEFENSLPMSRDKFKLLFDYLDEKLNEQGCDDTNALTMSFLLQFSNETAEKVLAWLADHGGKCDCEILANVEEQFE